MTSADDERLMTIGLPPSSGKNEEAQGRAAHVLWLLATNNPGAPVRIVNTRTVNTSDDL